MNNDSGQSVGGKLQAAAVAANTHFVGNLGLGVGTISVAGVAASVATVFAHLSDGSFLLTLGAEHATHTFGPAQATLDGSLIGIAGSLVALGFSIVASYLGKPRTISS